MSRNSRNRNPATRWLVLLAIGSLATAIAASLALVSTGRGHTALQRLAALRHHAPPGQVRVEERLVDREVVREVEVPVAANAKTSDPSASYDTRKLYNGIRLEAKLDKATGQAASVERVKDDSYAVQLTLRVKAPQPVTTLEGLESAQDGLGTLLPGLREMLPSAKVSPYFSKLYANKEERLQRNLLQLDKILSRHNYFDCETILEMQYPGSGRKVLLVQAEMDVVSDGSDGDRLPEMPEDIVQSTFYQPTTSYGWPKSSTVPNPLVAGIESRVKKAREDYAVPGLPADRNAQLKATIDEGTRLIADLKRRSFLIAEYDPFMVLPVFILTDREATGHVARVGDYAAIIHGKQIFPAIVGDAGPDFKIGEASLRVGREITPGTNPYRRPVNDLKVTYLVFPGSADPLKSAPDLAAWHTRCMSLIGEIGGLGDGASLHVWEDILKRLAEEREAKRKAEEEAARRKAEEEERKKAAEAEAARLSSQTPPQPPAGATPTEKSPQSEIRADSAPP